MGQGRDETRDLYARQGGQGVIVFWILLLILLSLSWVMPWWFYFVAALLAGFKTRSAWQAFTIGFFATGLSWVMAAYLQDLRAEGQISLRLSAMFGFASQWSIYPTLFVMVGLSAGLFCSGGHLLSLLLQRRRVLKERSEA